MILSVKPPYELNSKILKLILAISSKLGEVNASYLNRSTPQLRKQNRIKTIHASLQIEGNTLTEEQMTAILQKKRVIGPKNEILEVLNALAVYENANMYKVDSQKSFLKAHADLMNGLVEKPGKYRTKGVGIVKGTKVEHLAPPYQMVPAHMKNLFEYLKNKEELTFIKSCVFHYELEFIHPFLDGNGRMGRLWQTLILAQEYPVFEFLAFETLISQTQKAYYKALSSSDKLGHSTPFIEYMLDVIDQSLEQLLQFNHRILKDVDRLAYFIQLGAKEFTRKDYMNTFKNLSSATASRDLKKGIALKLFKSTGEQNKTKYIVK